ncbi:hypothetical protein [Shinella sp. M27]|uniref:hypothetical protein n=1 Tax=Shinella sp. M27 TaxID=3368614 RepID=UPI003BA28BFD
MQSFRMPKAHSQMLAGLLLTAAGIGTTIDVHAAETFDGFGKLESAYVAMAGAKACDLEWDIGPRLLLIATQHVKKLEKASEYRPLELKVLQGIAAEQAPMLVALGGCGDILVAFKALEQDRPHQTEDHIVTTTDQQQKAPLSTDQQPLAEVSKEPETTATDDTQLPIAAGAYVRKRSFCDDLRAGQLEMIDFDLEENGRSFSTGENACVISSIKPLSASRSQVKADCDEFGETSQMTFMLDKLPSGDIRINGDDHFYCSIAATTATYQKTVETLIEQWADEEENCRGGSGDDPSTLEACERRSVVSARLERLGYCYEGETTASSEWKLCADIQ